VTTPGDQRPEFWARLDCDVDFTNYSVSQQFVAHGKIILDRVLDVCDRLFLVAPCDQQLGSPGTVTL
jgi:hypothetical protein